MGFKYQRIDIDETDAKGKPVKGLMDVVMWDEANPGVRYSLSRVSTKTADFIIRDRLQKMVDDRKKAGLDYPGAAAPDEAKSITL